MKRLIIIFFCFHFGLCLADDIIEWKIIDSFKTNRFSALMEFFECADSMNCVYAECIGEYTGYIINRTSDGGDNWTTVYADTAIENPHFENPYEILRAMQYPNRKLCIMVGDSGLVLRSTDNGSSWEKIKHDSLFICQIFMNDEYEGFILAFRKDSLELNGTMGVWKTYNGGINFTRKPIAKFPFFVAINDYLIQKIDDDLIIASEIYDTNGIFINKLLKVRNDWTSWDTVSRPKASKYFYFVDSLNGWAAGSIKLKDSAGFQTWSQLIYYTGDGGRTWAKQWDTVLNGDRIFSITMYDKNFGFVGSGDGDFIYTRDGGRNWIPSKVNLPKPPFLDIINKIRILTNNEALFFINHLHLVKYKRTPSFIDEQIKSELLISPNPASDYIEIVLNNHALKGAVGSEDRGVNPSVTDIRIFDLLGVEHPGTACHPSVEGNLRIDVSSLKPGVYFVRVGSEVRKFVKM